MADRDGSWQALFTADSDDFSQPMPSIDYEEKLARRSYSHQEKARRAAERVKLQRHRVSAAATVEIVTPSPNSCAKEVATSSVGSSETCQVGGNLGHVCSRYLGACAVGAVGKAMRAIPVVADKATSQHLIPTHRWHRRVYPCGDRFEVHPFLKEDSAYVLIIEVNIHQALKNLKHLLSHDFGLTRECAVQLATRGGARDFLVKVPHGTIFYMLENWSAKILDHPKLGCPSIRRLTIDEANQILYFHVSDKRLEEARTAFHSSDPSRVMDKARRNIQVLEFKGYSQSRQTEVQHVGPSDSHHGMTGLPDSASISTASRSCGVAECEYLSDEDHGQTEHWSKMSNISPEKAASGSHINTESDLATEDCQLEVAIADFDPVPWGSEYLHLDVGDLIRFIGFCDSGWKYGQKQSKEAGWYPATYTMAMEKQVIHGISTARICEHAL